MSLAQGHNAVTPVRLQPPDPRSRVKHSTTEPLRSLQGPYLMHNLVHALFHPFPVNIFVKIMLSANASAAFIQMHFRILFPLKQTL